MIKKTAKKSAESTNKKISFLAGLEIVKSIQRKVEILNKGKSASPPPNEYSF